VHNLKPPLSQLPSGTYGYNIYDSLWYENVNGQVVATEHIFTYSEGLKRCTKTSDSAVTGNYSTLKKMFYYLRNDIPGNIPLLTDAPTSTYRFINTTDSVEYRKYNGVMQKTYIRYAYNPYKNEEAPDPKTNYYVATYDNGGRDSNTGLSGSPWLTVYKACTSVPSGAYTINVGVGTFVESHICPLPVGVSVIGAGKNVTIIIGTYTETPAYNVTNGTFKLYSATAGTNGNQSISNLTLDGGNGSSSAGIRAISVHNRGHVYIHDCIIKDFYVQGVCFNSAGAGNTSDSQINWTPAVYEQDNRLYNCTIDNCVDAHTVIASGDILISCQDGLLIHDNYIYGNKRLSGHNSDLINGTFAHFKNCKYYNNQSWKPDVDAGWNFHLELWNSEGGFELYGNTFTGGANAIDCGGHNSVVGVNGYAWSIHDNVFEMNTEANTYEGLPISLEAFIITKTLIYNNTFNTAYIGVRLTAWNLQDVYIYDNVFNKVRYAVYTNFDSQTRSTFPVTLRMDNINIYRNKIYEGISGISVGGSLYFSVSNGEPLSNVNIYNNTITSDGVLLARGIQFEVASGNSATNINVKNNIFYKLIRDYPIRISNNGTMSNVAINYNLLYNPGGQNTNPLVIGNSITNYAYTNNIVGSDPLFVNATTQNYTLQATSPAVNSGQVVQIDGSDLPYLGVSPDRGYVEY
jgi:hypothetical protein